MMEEKERFEEFEMVEKTVEELKKLWEENEDDVSKEVIYWDEAFSFFLSLPLPEISPFLLEKTSNKFLKEFDWKKFKKRGYLSTDLGIFIFSFLKKNIENHASSQKRKGIREKDIEPIEVHLKVEELPVRLGYLGYQNPEKLHLIVEGSCGNDTGCEMQGGKIIVKGDCGDWTGEYMRGGELIVKGRVEYFHLSAFSPSNQGIITLGGIEIWKNGSWTKEGEKMWERGEIPIEWAGKN